jgi:hypothetical protein
MKWRVDPGQPATAGDGALVAAAAGKSKPGPRGAGRIYGNYIAGFLEPQFWLPSRRRAVIACRVWKLVGEEVGGAKGTPPVPSDADIRVCRQLPGGETATWINQADGDPAACFLDWPPEVAVVTDHYRPLVASGEDVDEKMRGYVDVAALLLISGHAGHECGVGDRHTLSLHPYRPPRLDKLRFALLAFCRQRTLDHLGDVVAVLDVIDDAGGSEGLQVHVLVSGATRIRRSGDPRRAIHDAAYRGAGPDGGLLGDEGHGEGSDIEPSPAGGAAPAKLPAGVVEVIGVYENGDLHLLML